MHILPRIGGKVGSEPSICKVHVDDVIPDPPPSVSILIRRDHHLNIVVNAIGELRFVPDHGNVMQYCTRHDDTACTSRRQSNLTM